MLRTTLSLEPEIMELAKGLALERKISLSESINFLIRKGLSSTSPFAEKNGLAVFATPPGAHRFGPEDVEKALRDA